MPSGVPSLTVTGASSGLGERFARVLHAVGADIVVTGRATDAAIVASFVVDVPGARWLRLEFERVQQARHQVQVDPITERSPEAALKPAITPLTISVV